jgi:hypothetical protein
MPTIPRKRRRPKNFTHVIANLPNFVELTKLNSRNSMTIQIRLGKTLLGTIVMGRGSVQWWPRGNSVNAPRKSWAAFADMLDANM